MIDQFEKGESIPRTITLTSDGTEPLDTDDFLTIEAKVFNTLVRVIGTYTLAGGEITALAPATSGRIFFVVPSATTTQIRALKYYCQVITTETDTDYPGNVRTRSWLGWGFKLIAGK